MTALL